MRVDLPELHGLGTAEAVVVEVLQLVPVAGTVFQQAEERVT